MNLRREVIDAVAVVGDAGHPATWSGIPCRFLQAARRHGWPTRPWRVDWARHQRSRWAWNLRQLVTAQGVGGYQYSDAFLDDAEAAVPAELWSGRVLSFSQHFPRAWSVGRHGGSLVQYVDATLASFCTEDGLVARLPRALRAAACRIERDNLQSAERVVTMARWAADAVAAVANLPRERVATILPGASLDLPPGWSRSLAEGWPGRDRPLVLGFVGKDWRRKGLPYLLDVRDALEAQGFSAEVRAIGFDPAETARRRGLVAMGFIDKAREPQRFLDFLAGCDVGCLFSRHEPLGISTLEFLRVGVPVAGFAIEGLSDTLPPGAGFRFDPRTPAAQAAEEIAHLHRDAVRVERLRANAAACAPEVTWERCIAEWQELLDTGEVSAPLELWRGRAA